jgi:hypothetical protein
MIEGLLFTPKEFKRTKRDKEEHRRTKEDCPRAMYHPPAQFDFFSHVK